MKVAVLGLGYVGSVTAACLADNDHIVSGADPDVNKVEAIVAGRSAIVEPGLEGLLGRGVAAGRLSATTSTEAALGGTDVSLICVGTPSQPDGALDPSSVVRAATEVGHWLATNERYHLVVVRSTVLPGTVEGVILGVLEHTSGKEVDKDFGVAMCPEFLRESSAVRDFYDPPFTIAGVRDARAASTLRDLLGFLPRPWHEVPVKTAEAVKYSCNAFHAVKITFANEIARIMHASGVDGRQVMQVFCDDDRLNLSPAYLQPGFSFGGSCLPKDLRALLHLSRAGGQEVPMLASLLPSNELHLREALRTVIDAGHRRVALLGLAFKAGTDDLRESPYVELAEALLSEGIELRIYDPTVNPDGLFGSNLAYIERHLLHLKGLLCHSPEEALEGVGCAVAATSDLKAVNAIMSADPPMILDLCGRLPVSVEGLTGYCGLAW